VKYSIKEWKLSGIKNLMGCYQWYETMQGTDRIREASTSKQR